MSPSIRTSTLAIIGALGLFQASPLAGQDVQGRVVDATTGTPVEGALVEVVGQRAVTLTDREGGFAFLRIWETSDSLVVSRYGYASARIGFTHPLAAPLEIALTPAPIELEGITTEVPFDVAYEELQTVLDARIGVHDGQKTVATMADLRPFDERWAGDPYSFLHHGPLKVSWVPASGNGGGGGVYVRGYGGARPSVFIDDEPVWLRTFLEYPNTMFCRVETYMPPRFGSRPDLPPPMIRAYTCSFLMRVAAGLEQICPNVSWGGLLAQDETAPQEGETVRGIDFRGRDARPGGAAETGESGGTVFIAPSTIGVGSSACG